MGFEFGSGVFMRKRQLGNSDLELTTVGLGTWAIGGPWQFGWGKQDDADSIDAIVAAIDSGINWIDTAPIYGCGHSEVVGARNAKQILETSAAGDWELSFDDMVEIGEAISERF